MTSSTMERTEAQPWTPPKELQGLTQEAMAAWKHHPVTKAYRRYLQDYRQQVLEDHLSRWHQYQEFPDRQEEYYRAMALVIQDILTLDFTVIDKFYKGPEDSNKEASDA